MNASYLRVSSYAPGDRSNLAWGVDALYTSGPLSLEGEILSADRHLVAPPALKARDFDLTGALDLSPLFGTQATQFVLRVEQYDPDTDTRDDEMLMVIPSLNLVITPASRIQVGIIHQAPAASGMDAGTSGVVVWQVNFF